MSNCPLNSIDSFDMEVRVLCLFSLLLGFSTCKDKEEGPSIISFESPEVVYDETAGRVKIGIRLTPPRNSRTRIPLTWTSTDPNTQWGGDFEMEALNFNLGSFKEIGYFEITVLNDHQIDADDVIVFQLGQPLDLGAKPSGNPSETKHKIVIKNDDKYVAGTLHADLTWKRPNRYDEITVMNMDIYVQTGVILSGNQIINIGNTYKEADNTGRFETVILNANDPDQSYFFAVFLQRALLAEYVDYTLTVNGVGAQPKVFSGKIDGNDVGAAIFYGPFRKSNGTFNFGRQKSEEVDVYRVDNIVF